MINEQIRDREVRVIGPNGEQLGIMSAKEAYFKAKDAGLDLVKIAPTAKPPVCKIIDYGKYRYEQARKAKEAKKKQKTMPIDFTLFLLSVLLFVVLYYMINPGLMGFAVPGTGKWSLGSTFYSVLLGYLLIRALLKYRNAGAKKLQEGLWLLLGAVNIVLVYGIFGQELGSLLLNLETVQKGNTGITLSDGFFAYSNLNTTYLFLFLRFVIHILPYVLNIIIVFLARRLLTAMREDLYREESVKTADKLARFCMWTLIVTIGLDAGFNLLQLFFQRQLYQMDYVVTVPVFSLAFVLAVLLFARYIREMQRLKADNDLFI